MNDDDANTRAQAKKHILRRRAKFVAAALAGVSTAAGAGACSKNEAPPIVQVPMMNVDASGTDPQTHTHTTEGTDPEERGDPPPIPEDNTLDAGHDPVPMVCLSPLPPTPNTAPTPTKSPKPPPKPPKPKPRPCLLMVLNDHDNDDDE